MASAQGVHLIRISMQHLQNLNELQLQGSGLTIGTFDGVHRGHQHLLKQLVEDAHAQDMPAVVLTFFPHPSVIVRRRRPPSYITTPEEKVDLLGQWGVDYVITQPFDRDLAQVTADVFLELLERHLGVKSFWMGSNFALGYQRVGNVAYLKEAGAQRGFKVFVVPPVIEDGDIISSTRVRAALQVGDVASASRLLGRPFMIPGEVQQGAGRGKQLGFPTANLEIWNGRAYPCPGVYACWAKIETGTYPAVTNIGVRPTFEEQMTTPVIETHLLDFDGDIYQKEVELTFIERLREERKFPGAEGLLKQIRCDITNARILLERMRKVDD